MKIVIIMGSPNKKGSTSILVDSFKKGAEERVQQRQQSLNSPMMKQHILKNLMYLMRWQALWRRTSLQIRMKNTSGVQAVRKFRRKSI